MNKDLYEKISKKYNLEYNDYDYWKKYKYDLTDEEVLERMDIKVIEAFLRKKKLEMLKKGSDDI